MPAGTPTATPSIAIVLDEDIAEVAFNADGLVPAIVQEDGTGKVLMMAWMNEAALRDTLETGRMTYWSRSRQEYWVQGRDVGRPSVGAGGVLRLRRRHLLFVVEQEGQGACHTGERTCFFRAFGCRTG